MAPARQRQPWSIRGQAPGDSHTALKPTTIVLLEVTSQKPSFCAKHGSTKGNQTIGNHVAQHLHVIYIDPIGLTHWNVITDRARKPSQRLRLH